MYLFRHDIDTVVANLSFLKISYISNFIQNYDVELLGITILRNSRKKAFPVFVILVFYNIVVFVKFF